MHFMTDIKKLLCFVENIPERKKKKISCSHNEHLSPYRVCQKFQGTIYYE